MGSYFIGSGLVRLSLDMQLSSFSSVFEIFTGLCFAYAGSNTFRTFFNETLLQIKRPAELLHRTSVDLAQDSLTNYGSKDLAALYLRLLIRFKKHRTYSATFENFPTCFETMFLTTGLYCLAVLVLGGLEPHLGDPVVHTKRVLMLLDLVLVYNLVIFTISHWFTPSKWKVPLPIPVLVVCGLCFTGWLSIGWGPWMHRYTPENINLAIISVVTAMSPFLMYFARVYFFRIATYIRIKRAKRNINSLHGLVAQVKAVSNLESFKEYLENEDLTGQRDPPATEDSQS